MAVSRESLGAWLIKCNPAVWDVVAFLEDGGEWIESWSVGSTYRNALMEPGDPIVFWVSGTRPREIESGIWGVGRVIGRVHPEVETEVGYWRDQEAMQRVRSALAVDIPIWEAPIPRMEVKDDVVLGSMEVIAMPQGSNPSFLTLEQWRALEPRLTEHEIPDRPPREVVDIEELVEVPDPVTRVLIEKSAIDVVWEWLEGAGWLVEDRQADNVGWDLTARRGEDVALVEVKGRFGQRVDVLLSPNEMHAAREHDNWELAVVTRALEASPTLEWFEARDVIGESAAALYRFSLPPSR